MTELAPCTYRFSCPRPAVTDGLCTTHYEARYAGPNGQEKKRRYDDQDGRCSICDQALAWAEAHFDHDHECCPRPSAYWRCGKCWRGVLCRRCNLGLSYFRDDPALLRAAADYLDHHHALRESRLSAAPDLATVTP